MQRLLRWLGEKGFRPELGTVAILEGDGYGWEAFVEARPCPDEEAVRRFYRRTGALLAVAYCINGNDFHFENLIAGGEYPFLVDWETIFTQRPPYDFPDTADVRAKEQVVNSVLVMGLLPLLTFQGADGVGVELRNQPPHPPHFNGESRRPNPCNLLQWYNKTVAGEENASGQKHNLDQTAYWEIYHRFSGDDPADGRNLSGRLGVLPGRDP
ncbi:DUF4135 domain-containing protein [Kyrpidia tusciae]|uniref:DUF4135 domain-containing protein n=1 Tax=Kyrpidia tusciae TaxID=33943 RepID=UPI000A069668|nr:DUF4135 domain-containing protein [Kyrpidia tusciae]